MSNTSQTRRVTPASSETLLTMLETLPGALFVIDDDATIVYANARAQAMTGATREEICGMSLWRGAPHLVSTSLYQTIQKVKQTREPTEVEFVSPATTRWLHVSLFPTEQGLALFFQEHREPSPLQHALSSNEQMYRDLLESFADGVTILTPDGLILDINQRPLAAGHLRREEVVGTPFTDLPAWSHDPAVQQRLRAAIAQASRGETVRFEARIHPRFDLSLDILMTISSHRNVSQQVEYLICAGRNITERKRAEDELRTLLDAIPHLVWIVRPDGSAVYANQRWRDYTGKTLKHIQGDSWLQFIHPDDRSSTLEAWQTAMRTDTLCEAEYRIQQGCTGDYRWFLGRSIPYRDTQGAILYWVGTCTDIEGQKQAEQQLNESRENFRVLAETVPQLVWTTRPDGRVDYCNQRYCDLTQADFEQLRDYRWRQFLHPEDAERALALRQQSLATGELFENEQRLRDGRTGGYRWFLARALPVRDESGQILKWFGTCTDIEDQKRIEEALRQSQERIRALIDSNIIGITSSEVDGEVLVDANDAWLRMTGYSREEVHSRTLTRARITVPEDASLFERAIQKITAHGQHTPFETELVCKDGSRLPVLVGGVLFQDQPRQMVAFTLDNSARKELEQRKDDFISIASHELRNPLTALKLQTTLLHRQLARQGTLDQVPAIASMETQIKTITRLVDELLDVSKIQAGRLEYVWETVDLDALLREIVDTMQHTQPSHTILVHGGVQTSLIGDPDRLGQVFTNLLSNAIKYSPNAETVEVDLSTSPKMVMVRVRDHGLGIPAEQRDKIFERFYRVTGPKRRAISGLGMGLYIVAEIVKQHGGTITVESTIGKGSTFTVTLPLNRNILQLPGISH